MTTLCTYLHIMPEARLPHFAATTPFKAIVIIETEVSADWQYKLCRDLIDAHCLYALAWGTCCSSWDDAFDWANLEKFDFGEIPEQEFVITTWHENDTLFELFEFAKNAAKHPARELSKVLIVDIRTNSREMELLALYDSA